MTLRIRRTDAADTDEVTAQRLAFLRSVRSPDAIERAGGLEAATRRFVAEEIAAQRLHSWLAEHDGTVVGVVSLLLCPRPPRPESVRTSDGYIINMYVDAEHRHLGIGRRLLQACLASGDELGVATFALHATDDGRPLYESAGFVPSDTWMSLPVG